MHISSNFYNGHNSIGIAQVAMVYVNILCIYNIYNR